MSVLKINIVLFGKGNVGKEFLNQLITNRKIFIEQRNIDIQFPIITNSRLAYFNLNGVDEDWESNFALSASPYRMEDIFEYVKIHSLENSIAAEWEYAARAGRSHTKYYWGTELKRNGKWVANIFQGTFPNNNTAEDGFAGVAPVKSFPKNPFGIYDLEGNVWEWCSDLYRDD